jgi:hypothetical protein
MRRGLLPIDSDYLRASPLSDLGYRFADPPLAPITTKVSPAAS